MRLGRRSACHISIDFGKWFYDILKLIRRKEKGFGRGDREESKSR